MSTQKILVVEDEPGLLELMTLNLTGGGYEVVGTRDGLEALRLLDVEQPDLVTLDLNLPTVSGFRILQLLKAAPNAPIVLVITGYSFEEVEEVARSGADDFITKPVSFSDLEVKIRHLLERQRVTRRPPAN
jgi:two-component system response regulator RegX3